MYGIVLETVLHVRNNQDGIDTHNAIASAMLIPISVQFKTVGDSTISCFEPCIKKIGLHVIQIN